MRILIALAVMAGPAFAEDCPAPADVSAEMQTLFEAAREAPNARVGRDVSDKMWLVWLRAPDEVAQSILDRGMARRNAFDLIGAKAEFDRLAKYCPLYAEGFNQRAYINYLQKNFAAALVDLDKALALQPDHVAAQSGRGLTLMQMGRIEEARAQMLIAVENNPWLSEAALLADGAPLGLPGEEL